MAFQMKDFFLMAFSGLDTLRILLVENHLRMRMLIKQMLTAGGVMHIEEANNGAEALQYLHDSSSELPHLIISDLHMERLDGIELCNAIRRDKSADIREIPILVLTGDEDVVIHEAAEKLGAAHILTKPVSAEDLFKCIGRLMAPPLPEPFEIGSIGA
jgi:CheY-like chemotaxis protein